jgi:hypothetical protein
MATVLKGAHQEQLRLFREVQGDDANPQKVSPNFMEVGFVDLYCCHLIVSVQHLHQFVRQINVLVMILDLQQIERPVPGAGSLFDL